MQFKCEQLKRNIFCAINEQKKIGKKNLQNVTSFYAIQSLQIFAISLNKNSKKKLIKLKLKTINIKKKIIIIMKLIKTKIYRCLLLDAARVRLNEDTFALNLSCCLRKSSTCLSNFSE